MGPPWGPPGSCRPQMGHILAPRNLQSGSPLYHNLRKLSHFWMTDAIALLPTPHACRNWENMSLESTQWYLYNLTLCDGPEYDQPQNVLIEFCCLSAIVWNGQIITPSITMWAHISSSSNTALICVPVSHIWAPLASFVYRIRYFL